MTRQLGLWGGPPRPGDLKQQDSDRRQAGDPDDPETAALVQDTSRAAARSILPIAGSLRAEVLAAVRGAGEEGFTCDELEEALDLAHQTCSARVRELAKAGLIKDSGRRRPTRSHRNAIVWLETGHCDG